MDRIPHLRGRRGSSGHWRRRAVVALLLMLVGAGVALFYLTRPHRLTRMAAGVIQQLTGAEATIDTARLTRTGEIHLDGLVLTIPGEAADADPLLHFRAL